MTVKNVIKESLNQGWHELTSCERRICSQKQASCDPTVRKVGPKSKTIYLAVSKVKIKAPILTNTCEAK